MIEVWSWTAFALAIMRYVGLGDRLSYENAADTTGGEVNNKV